MSDGRRWEAPQQVHGRAAAVAIIVGVVALAVVLLRPTGSSLEGEGPQDDGQGIEVVDGSSPDAAPEPPTAPATTLLTRFDPVTLEDGGDVAGLSTSSAATSTLSREGLLLHHYDAAERVTRVQILNAALEVQGPARTLAGVVDMLALEAGSRALVWVEGAGQTRRIGRLGIADEQPHYAALSPGFALVELHGLRAGRVAAYGREAPRGRERPRCRVLVLDVPDDRIVVDRAMPDSVWCGFDPPPSGPREHPALVWDLDRELLHAVRVTGDLLTVDLRDGTTTGDDASPDLARGDAVTWSSLRRAVASPRLLVAVSTGSLDQVGAQPVPPVATVPLEPVAVRLDDGDELGRAAAGPDGARVVAVGEDHAVLADESTGGPLRLEIVLLDLATRRTVLEVDRQVILEAAFSRGDRWLSVLSRDSREQVVRVVDVASGEVTASRSFPPDVEVFLHAGVVVEHARG